MIECEFVVVRLEDIETLQNLADGGDSRARECGFYKQADYASSEPAGCGNHLIADRNPRNSIS